ncbi:MAG: DUF2760 domain-containing protein [Thermogutta sp.]
MRLGLAFRAFFAVLFDRVAAERVRTAFDNAVEAPPSGDIRPEPAAEKERSVLPRDQRPPQKAAKSDALILLEVLQREGRLIDFLKESIAEYGDAQVGAAVRDIHRDCAAALERIFAIRPAVDQGEGQSVELPSGYDSGIYRLVGDVAGSGPYRGILRHHGWKATACNLPVWTGSAQAAQVIAPAEVEVRT